MTDLKWCAWNSVRIDEIQPIQRVAGGGVTEDMLVDTKNEAIDQCIIYLEHRIAKAERRIRWLQMQKTSEADDE